MEHYLDNAATTAVLPCAMEAAVRAMEEFGNPGSLHAKGAAARKVLDDSRKAVAAALGGVRCIKTVMWVSTLCPPRSSTMPP